MDLLIKEFNSELKPYFETLNKAWIQELFTIEPIDEYILQQPEEAIIQKGGKVLFGLLENKCVATVALKPMNTQEIELIKMAVDQNFRSLGYGKIICEAAIKSAQNLGYQTLTLYTNSSLKNAIGMYEKLGFKHVEIEKGKYERADVKMSLSFS